MGEAWRNRRAWLSALKWELPENLETPAQVAAFEGEHFLGFRKEKLDLEEDAGLGEAYEITSQGETWRIRGGRTGLLYGVYALIRCLLTAEKIPEGICSPYYSLRMLNAWDNMSGDIERGYAGRSLWFEGGEFRYEPDRIRQLGRMLAFAGINVLCINNVNVHAPAQGLADEWLPDVEAFARILRPFGVRLMLSIDFSMPLQRGLETADPLDPRVQEWWRQQADRIWETVPDLAGFLVKADSEHRPGPNAYGRTHAEGANMLARAVAPHGGVLVWRAFVYDCMQDWRNTDTDRPCAAYDLYHPMDGDFDENVILQVKNGPFDFQVREPVSPLFFGMPHTRLALELQLAQEYTGQQVDLYAMPSMWREIFDQTGKEKAQAIAAVTNLGRDDNWTGHPMAALNLYAFGRYAWDPDLEPEAVIREWVRLTYELKPEQENVLVRILLKSRSVYEKYTSPLGLCWMVNPAYHYGPSPYGYEFQAWGTYNRADRDAVGIDRTSAGTGYTGQYPPALRDLFENKDTCPENLLLFFHRLPYTWRMRDGRTLIQRIYDDHFEGYDEAEKMKEELETLGLPAVDAAEVIERAERQLQNAREWRDVINTFFHRLSGVPDEKERKIYL